MLESNIDNDASLSISCVYYDTNSDIFDKTLETLAFSVKHAQEKNIICSSELHLINNNPDAEAFFLANSQKYHNRFDNLVIHTRHGNIGYGRGNNLAIEKTTKKYHLILNPDIELAINALEEGICYLEKNSDVGLVAPHATNQFGEIEYLAKRMPSFLVLLLRGLNNTLLNKAFKNQLDNYAYKDKIPTKEPFEIELASGCFMLCRTETLRMCEGFSPDYFLYFEDFDLTARFSEISKNIYLPNVTIVHYGGNTSSKSGSHQINFLISAFRFLSKTKAAVKNVQYAAPHTKS
jgi:GT2 family glycosyltransferase